MEAIADFTVKPLCPNHLTHLICLKLFSTLCGLLLA